MSVKKKDLEIVYSLRWKNGPKNGDKDMSIIAVYDIPATTLNFEAFKSYLLKNSGTAEDDVKVSYLTESGQEYPIQSQTDFQIVLYSFRRKARAGEVINLLLERISDQPVHRNLRHSNDVETQSENMGHNTTASAAPDWFTTALIQLKKEVIEEVSAAMSSVVTSALSSIKPQLETTQICHHHTKKHKTDKKSRKLVSHLGDGATDAKELIKSLKQEYKLERKALKYQEKRMALHNATKSSDSEAGPSRGRSRSRDKKNKEEPKMDAIPVNVQTTFPHMLGGEIYMHQWEVQNSGEAPWTSKTSLQYTWGSKLLEPLNKIISVPYLKPGQVGTISVRLQIPNEPGQYECYWQFMHKGYRFGHWLGCQVIVDPFDLKGNRSVLETSGVVENHFAALLKEENGNNDTAVALTTPTKPDDFLKLSIATGKTPDSIGTPFKVLETPDEDQTNTVKNITEQLVREVSTNVDQINLNVINDSDSNSSDDDNQSLVDDSASSKCSFKDEFVMVPVPRCFVFDGENGNIEKADEAKPKPEQKKPEEQCCSNIYDCRIDTPTKLLIEKQMESTRPLKKESPETSLADLKLPETVYSKVVIVATPFDQEERKKYVSIHIDNQRMLIPKDILKPEILYVAEGIEEKAPPANETISNIARANSADLQSLASSTSTCLTPTQGEPKVENADNATDAVPFIPPHNSAATQKDQPTANNGSQNDIPSNYFEANNFMSHCSAAGSCYSDVNAQSERQNRVFVFPQDVPGYEVIYPGLDLNNISYPSSTSEPIVPTPTIPATQSSHVTTPNPFIDISPVPNYQQTPPEQRAAPAAPEHESRPTEAASAPPADSTPVHILPETLVAGAVNVASSAISTARSVMNMIKPQAPGRWENGHWVSTRPQTPREANLQALAEMGFWNRDLNATLLARYNDDLNRVVAELVQ